jgi:hypothetical protein
VRWVWRSSAGFGRFLRREGRWRKARPVEMELGKGVEDLGGDPPWVGRSGPRVECVRPAGGRCGARIGGQGARASRGSSSAASLCGFKRWPRP